MNSNSTPARQQRPDKETPMSCIRIVNEAQARGTVAEDYAFIAGSYSKILAHARDTGEALAPALSSP